MALASITATTLSLLRDQLTDQSPAGLPLFAAVEARGNRIEVDGGSRVELPLMIGDSTTGTQLTTGYEALNMAVKSPFRSAAFEWVDIELPIIMSAVEALSNKGELARVSIAKGLLQKALISLKRDINRAFMAGLSWTTNPYTAIQSPYGATTAASTGWLEGVVLASRQNSVGGLSQLTYGADGWANQYKDCGAALTLAKLDELLNKCMLESPLGEPPDMIFMSSACYNAFSALAKNVTMPSDIKDRFNFQKGVLKEYNGAAVYQDKWLGFTAQNPAKPVSAYCLNSANVKIYNDKDAWFEIGDMVEIPGSSALMSKLKLRFQIVIDSLAGQGLLLDAEA